MAKAFAMFASHFSTESKEENDGTSSPCHNWQKPTHGCSLLPPVLAPPALQLLLPLLLLLRSLLVTMTTHTTSVNTRAHRPKSGWTYTLHTTHCNWAFYFTLHTTHCNWAFYSMLHTTVRPFTPSYTHHTVIGPFYSRVASPHWDLFTKSINSQK